MIAAPELSVTLSPELLRHLRKESRVLGVPLEWLVAGMVADTLDEADMTPQPLAASP
jgi:hypothetical protein